MANQPWSKRYKPEDGVTQSMIGDWQLCRQKLAYQLEGYQKKGGISKALRWGTLIHAGLEALYKSIRQGASPTEAVLAINMAVEKQTAKDVKVAYSAENVVEIERDCVVAQVLLSEYVDWWGEDDFQREWLDVEGTFDVNFKGYRLRGKLDAIYANMKKRLVKPLETKTSSRIVEQNLLLALGFDFQCLIYYEAVKLFLDKKYLKYLQGPLYNILRTPGLRQKKKESEADFIQRITEDIQQKPDHYFYRFDLSFDKETIDRFNEELEARLTEYHMWLDGELATYRSEKRCILPYQCEFLELCAGDNTPYDKNRKLFRELEEEGDGRKKSRKKARRAKTGKKVKRAEKKRTKR